jgi:hypothetical protein
MLNRSTEKTQCGAGDLVACHPAARKSPVGDNVARPTAAHMFFITIDAPGPYRLRAATDFPK